MVVTDRCSHPDAAQSERRKRGVSPPSPAARTPRRRPSSVSRTPGSETRRDRTEGEPAKRGRWRRRLCRSRPRAAGRPGPRRASKAIRGVPGRTPICSLRERAQSRRLRRRRNRRGHVRLLGPGSAGRHAVRGFLRYRGNTIATRTVESDRSGGAGIPTVVRLARNLRHGSDPRSAPGPPCCPDRASTRPGRWRRADRRLEPMVGGTRSRSVSYQARCSSRNAGSCLSRRAVRKAPIQRLAGNPSVCVSAYAVRASSAAS